MDVESIIEHAVLQLRVELGLRITRKERQRLSELARYIEWRERAIDTDEEQLRLLWADSEVPPET